jgi:murein DD-endopeptidase MepM/ murein hydrolase activator NlpD
MTSSIFHCVMICVTPLFAATAYGNENRPDELSRQYIEAFLSGDLKTVFEKSSPELRAAIKNMEALSALRAGSVGDGAKVVDEQLAVTTTKVVKSASGQTFSITATVAADGTLVGFLIRPTGEAPSDFLNYKTKAKLRLPFDDTWNVFWGGRSVKENYHAAFPDQRFAYDILMLRDGTSHRGGGNSNSDYFCFEKPIVSPGAGVVVEAVDGIADNVPGKMNPAEPCGNHVVIDLGEKEFLFLAHFKNGSLKVKAGDHLQAGQALGLCGNSGNSSEPHLHAHLQNTPTFGAGKGLPLEFQHYLADGKPVERGEPTKGQAISIDAAKN